MSRSTSLLLVVLIIAIAAVIAFFLINKSGGKEPPPPAPPPGPPSPFSIVSDDEWIKAGVYPQRNNDDTDGYLNSMMIQNSGFHSRGQWSSSHFAFLFYPGVTYSKTVQIGYFTTIHGMGQSPGDVPVPVLCIGDNRRGSSSQGTGALDVFWRSAENIELLTPTNCPPTFNEPTDHDQGTCTVVSGGGILPGPSPSGDCLWGAITAPTWAASQASALRRVKTGHLMLDYNPPESLSEGTNCPAAFASGGFAADCDIALLDKASFSGQQQYMFVTTSFGDIPTPNVWNYVFAGCPGAAQQDTCDPAKPPVQAILNELPLSRSKPILSLWDKQQGINNIYSVYFDSDAETNVTGIRSMGQPHAFQIATNETELKALLSAGAPVIVLSSTVDIQIMNDVIVKTDGTTIVGLGVPTLSLMGASTVRIEGNNCCLCGIIFDCCGIKQDMLTWSSSEADPTKSGLLADCYFRVGGKMDPATLSCDTMCHVESGHLIIENAWMWRADHGIDNFSNTGRYDKSTETYYNNSKCGLHVEKGATVVAYGLACEHSTEVNCQWDGDNGELYYFQCELPYCVADNWNHPGLVVTGNNFTGVGLGVYCYFPDVSICSAYSGVPGIVDSGIVVPFDAKIRNATTVWLNGIKGSTGIKSVITCGSTPKGSAVTGPAPNNQAIVCS